MIGLLSLAGIALALLAAWATPPAWVYVPRELEAGFYDALATVRVDETGATWLDLTKACVDRPAVVTPGTNDPARPTVEIPAGQTSLLLAGAGAQRPEYAWIRCGDRISGALLINFASRAEILAQRPKLAPTQLGLSPEPLADRETPLLPRRYNVIMVLFDALSDKTFENRYVESRGLLDTWVARHAVERFAFPTHNVLGRFSVQNKFPMLANERFVDTTTMKQKAQHPWIWAQFAAQGYATMYGEELCGFNEIPRTFDISVISHFFDVTPGVLGLTHRFPHKFMCDVLLDSELSPRRHCNPFREIGNEARSLWVHAGGCYFPYCIGGAMAHSYYFDYLAQYVSGYRDRSLASFSMMFIQETHSRFLSRASWLDPLIARSLTSLEPFLGDSIIFLMADHGLHIGGYSDTRDGFVEHKRPLFNILVPSSLLDALPGSREALTANQAKLTSQYDVYATLTHILAMTPPDPQDINPVSAAYPNPWLSGSSLLEPLDADRSCTSLKIPLVYCATLVDSWRPVSYAPERARLANLAIDWLNTKTAPARDRCKAVSLFDEEKGVTVDTTTSHGVRASIVRFHTHHGGTVLTRFPRWELEIDEDAASGQMIGISDVLRRPRFGGPVRTACRPWELGVDILYCVCRKNHGVSAPTHGPPPYDPATQPRTTCDDNDLVNTHYQANVPFDILLQDTGI